MNEQKQPEWLIFLKPNVTSNYYNVKHIDSLSHKRIIELLRNQDALLINSSLSYICEEMHQAERLFGHIAPH